MAPKRFIDFLHLAERFHANLRAFCNEYAEGVEREDVRLLLRHVARHEEAIGRSLKEYEQDASKGVLESWFKVAPDIGRIEDVERFEFRPDMEPKDVLDHVRTVHDALISMYESLQGAAISEPLRDALTDLLNEEKHEEANLLNSLDDLVRE